MNFEREFAVYQAAMEIQSCLEEIREISMPNQIAEATRTISTGLDVIKKLADIAVKIKNIELQEAVLELKAQILSAKESLLNANEENLLLKEENAALKKELEKAQKPPKMQLKGGHYFTSNGDGPFCTACYDSNSKQIRLATMSEVMQDLGKYKCPVCNAVYQK